MSESIRKFVGGFAVGTLLIFVALMGGKEDERFTLLDALVIFGCSMVPGLFVGMAAWGLF